MPVALGIAPVPSPTPFPAGEAVVTNLDLISLSVGLLSAGITIAALVYAVKASRAANRAAEQSHELLTRLVVEPLRDLDRSYAKLNAEERRIVSTLHHLSRGSEWVSREDLSADLGEPVGTDQLAILAEEGWVKDSNGRWRINDERAHYMNFPVAREEERR